MRAPLRSLLTLALVGVAAAVPAFAQTSGAGGAPLSQYPTCSGKPTDADTNAAHGAYIAGKGSFDEADYGRAIDYFKDAYRRDCTKPELLVIIARAYELKGDKREAVNALETYVARVPNASDADVQKRHIANLKKEISEAPSASVAPLAPPSASIAPSAAPSASAAPTATAVPMASAPPPTSPSNGHSVAPWIVTGAGGAMVVTGGVLFLVGSGKVSSAESSCPNHKCPDGPSAQSNADKGNSGRSLETVGVIVGGVGLGAVAGGLLWHFLEPTGGDTSTVGKPIVAPQVGPGYAGVGVGGRF
jgi:hypothetical protein